MRKRTLTITLAALTAAVISACGPAPIGGREGPNSSQNIQQLALVGFAVPKSAHTAAQVQFSHTDAGSRVQWSGSFGASGDQSRAVASGLPADIVHFSLEGDVTRLVDKGLVAPEWNANSYKGIISQSVVVLVVRPGNPKNIHTWQDVIRDDVAIVTPNPGSSGSARWNVLAAYGSVLAQGGDEAAGKSYLAKFFKNVAALPGSGRDATTAFTQGVGDVLISYENEAITARQNGAAFDYVLPESTLLIENPAAVTVNAPPVAQAYLDFLTSETGQLTFASNGFRPLDNSVSIPPVTGATDPDSPFPTPSILQTIEHTFGGWDSVNSKFFGDQGIVTVIQAQAGKQ